MRKIETSASDREVVLTGAVLVTLGEAAFDDPPLLVFEDFGPTRLATVHGHGSNGEALPSSEGYILRFMNGRAATDGGGAATFSGSPLAQFN